MNKQQFLDQLAAGLRKLPEAEKADILQDFVTHFEFGLAEGKTEEDIAAGLGSPQQIAKELVATYRIEQVEQATTTGNVVRAVIAAISLGFFNLLIVLGPFLFLVGLLFGGWLLSISFILSPLLVLFNLIIDIRSFELFDLFFTLLFCGIGIFTSVGMYYVTKVLMKTFVKYLKLNVNLVKGES